MRPTPIRLALVTLVVVGLISAATPALGNHHGHAGVRLARLTGAAEVPDPGDPDGVGRATVIVAPARHTLCFAIWVDGITLPAAAAHVHAAPRGVAGDVVITLEAPDETGTSAACVHDLARRLLRAIKEHPRDYYVNVHTSDFPGGAVRGQLHKP